MNPLNRPQRAQLLAAVVAACDAKREARVDFTTATSNEWRAIMELHAAGIRWTDIALCVARAQGLPTSPEARKKLAARLRQRARRVTARHANRIEAVRSSPTAFLTSHRKEAEMAKLIRKTTTVEEFDDVEGDLEDVEDLTDDEQGGDDDEPERKQRARPSRRR